MDEKQIKRKLEDSGLRVADLAVVMSEKFGVTKPSADNMLRELIAGRRWYPVYAAWLKDNYGIEIEKPYWLKPVRERLALATA